jgi:hypothetical protein
MMAEQTEFVASPDHRVIAADTFSLAINQNMSYVRCGIKPGKEDPVLELGIIAMTPRSLKTLFIAMAVALEAFEERHGKIDMPNDQFENKKARHTTSEPMEKKEAAN